MPLVVPELASIQIPTKSRLLICGPIADSAVSLEAIKARGYVIELCNISRPIPTHLRTLLSTADLALLDITTGDRNILNTVHDLNTAIGICSVRPRILCFSTVHRNPRFVLGIEKCGARYVRVANPSMLVEAIELLVAEMNELERDGPCFQILHRYSQGTCAPGEEVSAVLLADHGEFRQLPLAVVERLVFDFLAQHRRIALDSSQIVSGLAGGWFYREHAANSGHREVKRVRRATVKIIVQRIRDAMTSTFTKAHARFDPRDVLRSCPAGGTNRVLYKLHADVRWHHVGERSR